MVTTYLVAGLIIGTVAARARKIGDARSLCAIWILVTLSVVGQSQPDSRAIYPFVGWTMYSSPNPARQYRDYLVKDSGLHRGRYPFGVMSFESTWPIQGRIDQLLLNCRCVAGDPLLDRFIDSLARVYLEHTGKTLIEVEIIDVQLAASQYGTEARRPVYTWKASVSPDLR